jgi:hypothetical protein
LFKSDVYLFVNGKPLFVDITEEIIKTTIYIVGGRFGVY